MKKVLSTILLILTIGISANAISIPGSHLSFMGIPLNGSISNFQQKLQAKGVRYDATASRSASKGTRFYKGNFAGYNTSNIMVSYIPSTGTVYQAAALFEYTSRYDAKSMCETLANKIEAKYVDHCAVPVEQDEDNYEFVIINDKDTCIGNIRVFIIETDYYYYATVAYYDFLNSEKNEKINNNDL